MSGPRLEGHGVGRLGAGRLTPRPSPGRRWGGPTGRARGSPWALGVGGEWEGPQPQRRGSEFIRVPSWGREVVFYFGVRARPEKLPLTLDPCIEFGKLEKAQYFLFPDLFRGGFPAPNLRPISPLSQNRGLVRREAQVISPSKRARPAEKGGMRLRFVRLSEHATAPTKGSERAAGYDLYSAYDYTVPPMEKALVKTDIQIALPSGCYGRVAPRSGLAAKHFIDVGAGVIDEDYRGNVGVVLFNFGKEKFEGVGHTDGMLLELAALLATQFLETQMILFDPSASGSNRDSPAYFHPMARHLLRNSLHLFPLGDFLSPGSHTFLLLAYVLIWA
ncbi:deoxyuridine 5'-triphosphate nucleotidohydrolase, mitochondrial isoform X4 [Globicephala melas]|uniref:deoxyuridine 5'-triphosphate nucleotidohydrolase, mitochondrial isoform X4 n=1 Tax=Globicephala melas TaxID=9731 RepID=UPI00293D378B|nr:deoxyuridine 5'-triphosphate nucleotidohydrolase, mitochondrial isoform X4 [Globicephala melas]